MQNISFGGCIPVQFYAKHPITKKYVPIVQEKNIKKCQRFVVRNLNQTLSESSQNKIFINAYKAIDSDYAKTPVVRSHYDKNAIMPKNAKEPAPKCIYLFSGKDVDCIKKLGRELGKEKSDIFELTGEKNNPTIQQAKKRYQQGIMDLIEKICPRVNDGKGNPYTMRILFTPQYNKKGNLKGFKFQDVFFDYDKKY